MMLVLSLLAAASVFFLVMFFSRIGQSFAEVYQSQIERHANTTLADMYLFVSPKRLLQINLVSMFVVWLVTLIISENPVFSALAGVGAGFAPRIVYKKLKERRTKLFLAQLPDGLQTIATSMRVGASFKSALEQMVREQLPPISQEFGLVIREIRMGVEYDEAFRNLEKRLPLDEVNLLVSAVLINKEVGGNLADILAKLSSTVRRKLEMEGKIDALTAQGRMQGWVMTGLPVFVGLALSHIEPEAMGRITTELSGWVVIIISTILLGIGYFFIQKIVNIDV
ncbi:type II secretion system F family protein [Corallincola platygyrae]|uniref:Type II secretion system F family protein n=1 Tax=Corallincola platygyrae TaxID=1193278 RepID=A0ABW4XQT0_9GAMM